MYDKSAKSLRWLANQFPAAGAPKDDTDRISTCIHLYCAAGADAIETLTAEIAALQAENAEKDKRIARVAAERDAAMAEIPHVCCTCKHKPQKYGVCGMGCEVDPLTIHHAERCNWEWRGAQGEG